MQIYVAILTYDKIDFKLKLTKKKYEKTLQNYQSKNLPRG